jgi:deazaflavin-dependent oxidoreductase (nitroreductase family)
VKQRLIVLLDRTLGRAIYRVHALLYRRFDGRFVNHAFGLPVLLLTTTGRKTGLARSTPLLSFPVDERTFAVAGSNGGRPQPPAWLLNLTAHPDVHVQHGRRRFTAKARIASDEERGQLWPLMTAKYNGWSHYQTLTNRTIPVVLLTRVDPD